MAVAFCPSEARRSGKRPVGQPRGDCKAMVDSLASLYRAGDPSYLTWDFSAAGCDSAQLYSAYYYQGLGFLYISAWREALYFLSRARDLGGPKDEEILFHMWTVNRKLDRYSEMERLALELHQRYPGSLLLLEILDEWKSLKSPSPLSWGYSSKAAWARNPYLDHVLTNRVRAETRQKRAAGQFRETASLAMKTKWDQTFLQGFQANLGGEWERQGFSMEGGWGLDYESRRADTTSLIITSGAQSILVDSNWNFGQGRVALGYSLTTHSGWSLGWNLSLFQLSPDWRVLGLSHSQSHLFSDFVLIAYIDLQNHWIDVKRVDLDGMQSFSFNLTPYFAFGRQSLGLGPSYYVSRWHYGGREAAGLRGTEWQHSLAGTASYGYDLRQWCRLAFSLSYGYDFNSSLQTGKFHGKDVYGLDGGFSLSY